MKARINSYHVRDSWIGHEILAWPVGEVVYASKFPGSDYHYKVYDGDGRHMVIHKDFIDKIIMCPMEMKHE